MVASALYLTLLARGCRMRSDLMMIRMMCESVTLHHSSLSIMHCSAFSLLPLFNDLIKYSRHIYTLPIESYHVISFV